MPRSLPQFLPLALAPSTTPTRYVADLTLQDPALRGVCGGLPSDRHPQGAEVRDEAGADQGAKTGA